MITEDETWKAQRAELSLTRFLMDLRAQDGSGTRMERVPTSRIGSTLGLLPGEAVEIFVAAQEQFIADDGG